MPPPLNSAVFPEIVQAVAVSVPVAPFSMPPPTAAELLVIAESDKNSVPTLAIPAQQLRRRQ